MPLESPRPLPPDFADRLARAHALLARQRDTDLEAVLLFGSFARGDATPWSDVDIGVVVRTPLDEDLRVALACELADVLDRAVDVVDLTRAPLPLRGRAVRDAVPILVSDRDAWADFVARTTIEWLDFEPTYTRAVDLAIARLAQGRAA